MKLQIQEARLSKFVSGHFGEISVGGGVAHGGICVLRGIKLNKIVRHAKEPKEDIKGGLSPWCLEQFLAYISEFGLAEEYGNLAGRCSRP
jgi:hypothetical protein